MNIWDQQTIKDSRESYKRRKWVTPHNLHWNEGPKTGLLTTTRTIKDKRQWTRSQASMKVNHNAYLSIWRVGCSIVVECRSKMMVEQPKCSSARETWKRKRFWRQKTSKNNPKSGNLSPNLRYRIRSLTRDQFQDQHHDPSPSRWVDQPLNLPIRDDLNHEAKISMIGYQVCHLYRGSIHTLDLSLNRSLRRSSQNQRVTGSLRTWPTGIATPATSHRRRSRRRNSPYMHQS